LHVLFLEEGSSCFVTRWVAHLLIVCHDLNVRWSPSIRSALLNPTADHPGLPEVSRKAETAGWMHAPSVGLDHVPFWQRVAPSVVTRSLS
jgi:hypothetical protein